MLISLPKAQASTEEVNPKKRFDAGATIIEHVVDAYEWHIMTIGEKHISIPLPVILINDGKLQYFQFFKISIMAMKVIKVFSICHEKGPKKGKIVKIDEKRSCGNKASIIDLSITKKYFIIYKYIFLTINIFNRQQKVILKTE
jgi:F-type H+-transporting ATPase subunit a